MKRYVERNAYCDTAGQPTRNNSNSRYDAARPWHDAEMIKA